jgi:transcriptional regulator with XRE-family HTH domain
LERALYYVVHYPLHAVIGITFYDPIDVAVGARVRLRRKAHNITQSELAHKLGYTFQQIQKYERGDNRISASVLVKTAAILQCSVSELVGEKSFVGADDPALLTPDAAHLIKLYSLIKDNRDRKILMKIAKTFVDI